MLRQDPIIIDSMFMIMQEQAKAYDDRDSKSKRGSGGDTIRKKKYV